MHTGGNKISLSFSLNVQSVYNFSGFLEIYLPHILYYVICTTAQNDILMIKLLFTDRKMYSIASNQ